MTQDNKSKLIYNPNEVKMKTKKIYSKLLKKSENIHQGNFKSIGSNDLRFLFLQYDHYFFDSYFRENYRDKIAFRLSQRMTKTGGSCKYLKRSKAYIITLSMTLIFQTFMDVQREIVVNGITCNDRLEATMRILEHEIIHLLEFILYGSSSCSKPQFKTLSYNIFSHTAVTHELVTQAERAYKSLNLKVGDDVEFKYDEQKLQGTISRITKRATVMVKNASGQYSDKYGNRYLKFLVPLSWLKKKSLEKKNSEYTL